MESKKSLTLNGMTGLNFLYIINAVAMIAVSGYLTSHFYDTLYPTKLGAASTLCNVSNFFNCDAATYSWLSNIAGVPISFFGIIVGAIFLISALMPSEALERTSSALAKYNFIGCVLLFFFSLGALGSLCPFCTLYYVLSGIAFYLFWKKGINTWKPDLKWSGIFGVILLVGSFFVGQHTAGKEDKKSKVAEAIVAQYNKLAVLGEPDMDSPYRIHSATEKFSDAPIRLTIFSDFECPFCKIVSDQMPEIIRLYGKHINIQYMFYPLDSKCNANMQTRGHVNACDAAAIAACDEKKFHAVHDDIFEHQQTLGNDLKSIAQRHGVESCLNNQEAMNRVITSINQADKFNLKSTPTIILNGRKIEGTIPNYQFFAIFEELLKGK
ncbi:MAG TPA: thioredoxin domain-containing protein [Bacteriovoracaceae bacterium]|nr:thioredoxin domain-containing protein [Bacteriovoracaceae bacterium]HLW57269.1 thioredoxin domain-containing protein [Bacteriovoracaceae bacterium]